MQKTAMLIIAALIVLTACSKKDVAQSTQAASQTVVVQQQVTKDKPSEITKPSEPVKQEKATKSIYLSDLQYDKMDGTYKKGIISFNRKDYGGGLQVDGHPYTKGISARLMSNENGSVQYLLDGKYQTFSGKIGMDDGSQSRANNTGQVTIYADDKEMYKSEILKKDQSADFNLKIDGVKSLKVVLSAPKDNGSLDPAIIFDIVDPKLE